MCSAMGQYTKESAISIVVSCAEQYRDQLANRNLLFICQDKHKKVSAIEFSFDASNFLHLTGLKVKKRKYNQYCNIDVRELQLHGC